jgi:hypothetical protein
MHPHGAYQLAVREQVGGLVRQLGVGPGVGSHSGSQSGRPEPSRVVPDALAWHPDQR